MGLELTNCEVTTQAEVKSRTLTGLSRTGAPAVVLLIIVTLETVLLAQLFVLL